MGFDRSDRDAVERRLGDERRAGRRPHATVDDVAYPAGIAAGEQWVRDEAGSGALRAMGGGAREQRVARRAVAVIRKRSFPDHAVEDRPRRWTENRDWVAGFWVGARAAAALVRV